MLELYASEEGVLHNVCVYIDISLKIASLLDLSVSFRCCHWDCNKISVDLFLVNVITLTE